MSKSVKIRPGLDDSIPMKLRLPPCPLEIYSLMAYLADVDNDKIKLRLLNRLGLDMQEFGMGTRLEFTIPTILNRKDAILFLNRVLRAARIVYLSEVELYFVGDDDYGPFSPINELESLNAILEGLMEGLREVLPYGESAAKEAFQLLEGLVIKEINGLAEMEADTYSDCGIYLGGDPSFDALANSKGIKTKLKVANISKDKRGLVASEDINIGDIILEIPFSEVVSDRSLDPSMVEKYCACPYVKREDILALKIMKDGWCPDLFPKEKEIKTGLSFCKEAVAMSEGTSLYDSLDGEPEWVRRKFREFLRADPGLSLEKYLHAYKLLQFCGIKVFSQGGSWMSCLAPFAGFFNRSLFPHVLRCGEEGKCLRFVAARPCAKGQQCYLSYGYLSVCNIVMNYGSLPKGKNHNDCIVFDRDSIDGGADVKYDDFSCRFWMVRGVMKNEGINCLSKILLEHLKYRVKLTYKDINDAAKIERYVICIIAQFLGECLKVRDFDDERKRANYKAELEKPTWDVKVVLDYRKMERDLCESTSSACGSALATMMT